jgi:hypothetical protein
MNMATLNQITKYNLHTETIRAKVHAKLAKSQARRNKRVLRMVARFIRRLGGQNAVLQKGITAANTTIVENRCMIASAEAVQAKLG